MRAIVGIGLVLVFCAGCGRKEVSVMDKVSPAPPAPINTSKASADDECGVPMVRRIALSMCQLSATTSRADAQRKVIASYRNGCFVDRDKGLAIGAEMALDVSTYNTTCDQAMLGRNPEIGSAN